MSQFSKPSDLTFLCPEKGATFPSNFEFITIPELMKTGMVERRHEKVLLLSTLYIKAAPSEDYHQMWTSKKDSGKYKYERILYAMDPNAREGNNIVAFILGRKTNVNFFKYVLSIRDEAYLGESSHSVVITSNSYYH